MHEKEVGKIALEMGFEQVSLSSTIMPMVRVVPRGYTGKVNSQIISASRQLCLWSPKIEMHMLNHKYVT